MSDGIMAIMGEDGKFHKYDDTYDIVIHCESLEEQKKAVKLLKSLEPKKYKKDRVKVVRCKDCKWFKDIGCAMDIVDDSDKPSENDYCSFGELKEELDD